MDLQEAMAAHGLTPREIISNGEFQRFSTNGQNSDDSGWYVCYEDRTYYGNWRTGERYTWPDRANITEEQRAAFKQQWVAERKKRDAEDLIRHRATAKRANETWEAAATDGPSAYLLRKQCGAYGIRFAPGKSGRILVPMRDRVGKLWSIQAILDSPMESGRDKLFMKDGRVRGLFHLLGADLITSVTTAFVAEGYSTAASIHEATGTPVVCCFDAGNVTEVMAVLCKNHPNIRFILCADDDRWGSASHRGLQVAKDCERRWQMEWVMPAWDGNGKEGDTDFNDMAMRLGIAAVRTQLQYKIAGPPNIEPPPPPMSHTVMPPPDYDIPSMPSMPMEMDETPDRPIRDEEADDIAEWPHFKILGHDGANFYFFSREGKNIVKLGRGGIGERTGLIALAPLSWWSMEFAGGGEFNKTAMGYANDRLVRTSYRVGRFLPERIRGYGAWMDTWKDETRFVLHLGDRLLVNGRPVDMASFQSRYLYEAAARVAYRLDAPLTKVRAHKLVELCEMMTWEHSIQGKLLAGWCVLAPVCGALDWRPHIWITAESGAGKSWLLENVVSRVAGEMALRVNANSSEAGLRRAVQHDARPIVFDEAENEGGKHGTMKDVITLMRQSSSGGKIIKAGNDGGAVSFDTSCMFALASIVVSLEKTADFSRTTILTLLKDSTQTGQDNFRDQIEPMARELLTDEWIQGLHARTIGMLPTIRKNAVIFRTIVARAFGDIRAGQQIGTLLAGVYSLKSDGVITEELAEKIVASQTWTEQRDVVDERDEELLFSYLMQSQITVNTESGGNVQRTIHELILIIGGRRSIDVTYEEPRSRALIPPGEAKDALNRFGIKIVGEYMYIAQSHFQLAKLLRDSDWSSGWDRVLLRLPGAHRERNMRFGRESSRSIAIPLEMVWG